ncbi:MAG: metallo-mystery pair system four-Cys motif protein [Pseudomonadota bacterium]|nr:metallo-mystery pair system four-Cys motif protein [Pseudomonadota bacterium]
MRLPRLERALLVTPLLLPLVACTPEDPPAESIAVEIPFALRLGAEDVGCGIADDNVGTSATIVEILDARFYVHDLALLAPDGTEAEVTLEPDGVWQRDTVALLDFENGTLACETGSPGTHKTVTGTAPAGDWDALRFTLGVPSSLAPDDAAAPPLDDDAFFGSPAGGYLYTRIDVQTRSNPAFAFHLGATDCAGDDACPRANLATIALEGFTPGASRVVLDLATLYADSDLDAAADGVTDLVSGCTALPGDPECAALLGHLGLAWEDGTEAAEADAFEVDPL